MALECGSRRGSDSSCLAFVAAEVELVDDLQRVTGGVAGAELCSRSPRKILADLVFEAVGVVRALAEPLEVGEEVSVDEVDQVGPGQGRVVVELCRPFPWALPRSSSCIWCR